VKGTGIVRAEVAVIFNGRSDACLSFRIVAGKVNARQTLTNPEVLELPDRLEGVRTFDIGRSSFS
jgi:hypothetical protein